MNLLDLAASQLTPEILDESPKGRHCAFVDLGNGWGIKAYKSEYQRDYAYGWQKVAATHELGPEVGDKFDAGNFYCYITEVVEVARGSAGSERSALANNLELKTGIYNSDLLDFNCGWKNGKLVCIDFGGASGRCWYSS